MEFPKRPNFKEIEEKCISFWMNDFKDIYTFNPNSGKPWYIIDSPPPFTSGEAHMGHVLGWIWMDFIARYKRMKGFEVYLPQGWDVHGLPTELKVEKKLGISKEDTEKFIEVCREWTLKFRDRMKKTFIKIGFMADWSKEYMTMDEQYKKLTQKTLIDMLKKGYIYKGKHPVYWCPNCKTAISPQEIGYIEKEGIFAYIKLPIKNTEDYIEIATTRPELLPACICVLVHPEDNRYKEYIGKKVIIPLINREVPIIADKDVDPNFGTGAVWVCTYGDYMDLIWQKRYDLPYYEIITPDGRLKNTGIEELEGLPIEHARKKILELLENEGYLIKVEKIKHNVLCHIERSDCKSPIEFILSEQWFIKIKEFKNKLLELQKEIKFYSEDMRQKLIDWINSIEWDWIISRDRVWGCPFPFWVCENGHIVYPEEKDLPIDPRIEQPPYEKCPICNAKLKPVTQVLDCWVESSITPIAILKYANIDPLKGLPVDLRPQGYEIIRTWLFDTLLRVYLLTNKIPWKTVLINGMVLDPKGRKMSKSLGNVINPNDVLEKYSADSIRYWALMSTPSGDYAFQWKELDAGTTFLIKIWNISRFIWLNLKNYDNIDLDTIPSLKPIDIWILSELYETTKSLEKYAEEYRFLDYIKTLRKYIWDLFADNYLELVKYRLKEHDYSAIWTLYYIWDIILRWLAPAFPFITEELYYLLYKKRSIHGETLKHPEVYGKDILIKGKHMLDVIKYIRKYKTDNKIKLKEKIDRLQVPFKKKYVEPFVEDIKKSLNIEELIFEN